MTTKVAIKGSKSNSSAVIKLLENAGGKNTYKHKGNDVTGYYYINSKNDIVCCNLFNVPQDYEKLNFLKISPILFSSEMVKAILDGRKTQTRRVIKPQPIEGLTFWGDYYIKGKGNDKLALGAAIQGIDLNGFCPYGNSGDILWVREKWAARDCNTRNGEVKIEYAASEGIFQKKNIRQSVMILNTPLGLAKKWKPSIHMPKDVCRLFLKVKSVRVERLRDISEEDARAEGVEETKLGFKNYEKSYSVSEFIGGGTEALRSFQSLWKSINGPESWDANPWVWVIEFEVI